MTSDSLDTLLTRFPSLSILVIGDFFLDRYLETVGTQALDSVGGYQLEGPGAQLFTSIRGDYFAILGLPLLPLLDHLRQNGVMVT